MQLGVCGGLTAIPSKNNASAAGRDSAWSRANRARSLEWDPQVVGRKKQPSRDMDVWEDNGTQGLSRVFPRYPWRALSTPGVVSGHEHSSRTRVGEAGPTCFDAAFGSARDAIGRCRPAHTYQARVQTSVIAEVGMLKPALDLYLVNAGFLAFPWFRPELPASRALSVDPRPIAARTLRFGSFLRETQPVSKRHSSARRWARTRSPCAAFFMCRFSGLMGNAGVGTANAESFLPTAPSII